MRVALAALLLVSTAATATVETFPKKRAHLEKTSVLFPTALWPYRLVGDQFDPAQFSYGVALDYAIDGAPEYTQLSVFVYPLGRTDESEAVAAEARKMASGMQYAVDHGLYTDLQVHAGGDFVVARPAPSNRNDGKPSQTPTIEPERTLEPGPHRQNDPVIRAIVDGVPPANNHGFRQYFSFRHESVPMRTMGYVFYRNLFMIKLLISSEQARIGQPEFEKLADAAARALVPAMDVRNFGTCGQPQVAFPKPPAGANEVELKPEETAALVAEIARINNDNCNADDSSTRQPPPQGYRRQIIAYPPGTWSTPALGARAR